MEPTSPEPYRGLSLNAFATVVALLLSAAAVVYAAGIQSAEIAELRRRIDKIESQNDRTADAVARIDTRTATIEAKLQLLIPDREVKGH